MLNFTRPFSRSIGLMQAAAVLVATLVIGLALSAVQLSIVADQHRDAMRTRGEDVLTLAEGGAARAAWTLDRDLAKEVVNGIIAVGGFRTVSLLDDRGSVLASARAETPSGLRMDWIREWLLGKVVASERPLSVNVAGNPRLVGRLLVEQDPRAVVNGFLLQARSAILAILVQSLLVGLLLLWISSRLITSHLRRAASELAIADPEHVDDVELTISPIHRANEFGDLLRNTNLLIARLQESRRELVRVASHDSLTHLPNRSLIRGELESMLSRVRRADRRLIVMFLDLDRFKSVNDLHGHEYGDALLVSVARALSHVVRDSDIVGRLSGDEFLVVMEGIGEEEDIVQMVNRVVEAVTGRFDLGDKAVSATVSAGVAVFPDDGDDPETLIHHADLAMYRAKAESGSGWCFYSREIGERVTNRLQMEADLAGALERGELELHYQPRYVAETRTLIGCEALVRWRRDGRLLNAVEFIGLAEDSGLILEIGRYVLDEACRQAASWLAGGSPVRVAVNISGRQIKEQDLVAEVRDALSRHDLPASYLELEVTESQLIANLDNGRKLLSRLRKEGVAISIDDFGTGYSSLAYLIELPAASLKIDRSFVSGNNSSPVILGVIVAMAASLAMSSVAEGVETEAQLELLTDLGCDEVQGYLFGAPVPASEFARLYLETEGIHLKEGRE